jgi:hypothetical protein
MRVSDRAIRWRGQTHDTVDLVDIFAALVSRLAELAQLQHRFNGTFAGVFERVGEIVAGS